MTSLFRITVVVSIGLMMAGFAFSGTTGKIAGQVRDAVTNEPLIGVNITVRGTARGAASNLDGNYFIINLLPGKYTLQVSTLGYAAQVIENVSVNVDRTTTVDIEMEESLLEGEVVTIVAKRPIIEVDRTFSTSTVAAQDMQVMPITNTTEVIEIQAGVVDGHFRGGRKEEVLYMLDGIALQDVYDNTQSTQINQDVIQELQVITGTFNAEYGQAMSGVVNLVTKEGGTAYHGKLGAQFGDFLSAHEDQFDNIDDISPLHVTNYDFSLSGPVPQVEKLNFYVSGRFDDSDGWMYGRRKFDLEFMDTWEQWGQYYMTLPEDQQPVFLDSIGYDPNMSDTENYVDILTVHGRDDNKAISMNPDRHLYLFGKMAYQMTPTMKFTYTSLWDDREYRDFDREFLNIPEGDYRRFRNGRTNNAKLITTLSQSAFLEAGYSNNYSEYYHYVYEDLFDPRYYYFDFGLKDAEPSYTMNVNGVQFEHFRRYTNTHIAQTKLSWQITPIHYIQAGANFNYNEVFYRSINDDVSDIGPTIYYNYLETGSKTIPSVADYNHDHYCYNPIEGAAYIQDKIELKSLVINAGLRFDYFDSRGKVLNDPKDTDAYHPIHNGYDTITDSLGNTQQVLMPLSERLDMWYKDPSPKVQLSPRLGIGYPISPTGVLHFAYGHFFQRPKYEYLYSNPEFEIKRQGAGLHTLIGNADLEAEKTISYEFGFDQAINEDFSIGISIFQRDIRGLISTDRIVETYSSGIMYAQYINRDIAEVRGFLLTLDKRYSNNISFSVDYTYQVAEGVASDPSDVYDAQEGDNNKQPIKQLIPLDWDRRHTLNVNVNYMVPQNWGVSVIGTIGSGLPYDIETGSSRVRDLGLTFENDGRKPTYMNMDLSVFKLLPLWKGSEQNLRLELMVRNLFDRLNENDVHKDTGRATYRTDIPENRSSQRPDINTFEEYFLQYPQYYSRPREVRIGLSYEF